jgi:HAMP domain-containing protein
MQNLLVFGFLILVLMIMIFSLVFTCSSPNKRADRYIDDTGHDYSAMRLSREFTEPLPIYDPTQPAPPRYTEFRQIVCISN